MKRIHFLFLIALTAFSPSGLCADRPATGIGDAVFYHLADKYLTNYLAWRPLEAVGLGYHEFDGKLTDFSLTSVNREVARIRDVQYQLRATRVTTLSPQASFDQRNLLAGIRRELFRIDEMAAYTRNPMTYAGALDVSPYIKRDFAPLEHRVRGIIAILNQASNVMAAGRANLDDSLPKPWVETAIEVGDGSAEFLEKDLVDALKDVKDTALLADFNAADHRAVAEMRGFVKFLKDEKLPRATGQFALGRDNFAKMLREG